MKYIVVENGIEYNDSGYDISGVKGVSPRLFDTVKDAAHYIQTELIEIIGDYKAGSIDEYATGYAARSYCDSHDEIGWPYPTYRELAEILKENNEFDFSYFPELLIVFEVGE